jgi:hypothetical protein
MPAGAAVTYWYGPMAVRRGARGWEVWYGERVLVTKPTLGAARDWILMRRCGLFVAGNGVTEYADCCVNCGGHREAHKGGAWT